MFQRISYNSFSNKINLWEFENGRNSHKEIDPELIYYVHDKSMESKITDIYGNPVIPKIAKSQKEMRNYKDTGIKTCETDVSCETKFLQSYYMDKEMKVDMNNINICTFDIEYDSSNGYTKPDNAIYPINLITLHFSQSGRLVTLGLDEYTGNNPLVKEYHWVHSEKMLLEKTIEIVRKEKIHVLTGWNIESFDCLYFVNRCLHHEISKNFSPLNRFQIRTKTENNEEISYVKFDGLSVLDYMLLYKKFTYESRESYSLQAIGMLEIDEGKIDYDGTLNDLAQRDWNGFVEYNVQDVLLVVKLENGNPDAKDIKKRAGLKLIDLAVTICYEALIPFEDVFSQMKILTGYILKFLHKEGMVLPDREHKESDKLPGGYVFATKGLFKTVISFDVESMYPHAIMGFNIGPDTLVVDPTDEEKENLYSTPVSEYKTWHLETGESVYCGGIYFRKDKKSVLNRITAKIFKERKDFKNKMVEARNSGDKALENYYDRHQLIRKILINSLYGVLGNPHFHLYNLKCARAITLGCQNLIKYLGNTANDYLKNYFYMDKNYFLIEDENNKLSKDVLCRSDTDSCFFTLDEIINKLKIKFETDEEFINWANNFVNNVMNPFYNQALNLYAEQYGIPQIINFKREKFLTHMLIISKKAYSVKLVDKEGKRYDPPKIDNVGGELIKKTTPVYCREKLTGLIRTIFDDVDREEVCNIIARIKREFKTKNPNEISILKGTSNYSKYAEDTKNYLEKGLVYAKGCPNHVRAGMNYNYTIMKKNLKLTPIANGSKIRYINITDTNFLKQDTIGWIGEYPKDFENFFKINYDLQFEKTFLSAVQSIFDVLNWGTVNLKISKMNMFLIE